MADERALYDAYRAAIGTDREEQAYADLRRAISVNEPPLGWTVEADRRALDHGADSLVGRRSPSCPCVSPVA